MNSRERLLLIVLVGVVGLGGFGVGTYLWFVKPLLTYNKTIKTLVQERDEEQWKWDTFREEHKRLELARLKSLPVKASDAQSVYNFYLEEAVRKSGLVVGTIQPSAPIRMKPVSSIPNIKEVGHQVMTFTLTARGELAELVKLMETLQTTPYEHRIRTLGVDRAEGTGGARLNVTMVIETLLVAKSENRPGHPPGTNTESLIAEHIAGRAMFAPMGWGLIGNRLAITQATPLPANRRYADIAKKNIFTGAIPIEKPTTGPKKEKGPPVAKAPPAPGNIPGYIRLVHTIPTHQEAYLINLFYRNEELKLSSNPKTGYQVRRISDDNGDYVFCFMKVLRVDTGVVYFQVKDDVFAIELGQTLDDAMQESLDDDDLERLGIAYDPAFAKDKGGAAPTKKKGSKGR